MSDLKIGCAYTGRQWCAFFGDDLMVFAAEAGVHYVGTAQTRLGAIHDLFQRWGVQHWPIPKEVPNG